MIDKEGSGRCVLETLKNSSKDGGYGNDNSQGDWSYKKRSVNGPKEMVR